MEILQERVAGIAASRNQLPMSLTPLWRATTRHYSGHHLGDLAPGSPCPLCYPSGLTGSEPLPLPSWAVSPAWGPVPTPHQDSLHSRFCWCSHICLSPRIMVPRHPPALRKWLLSGQSQRYGHPPHLHIGRCVPPQHPPEKTGASHVSPCQGSHVTKSSQVFYFQQPGLAGDTCWPNLASARAGPGGSRRSRHELGFEKKG